MISSSIVPVSIIERWAKPRIGYHTILPFSTVTASSATSENPKEFIYDYLTSDAWMASSGGTQWIEVRPPGLEDVDYVGIAAHNLATARASFILQYWRDGVWNNVDEDLFRYPAGMMDSNDPVLFMFSSIRSNRFRLYIRTSVIPVFIGVLFIGRIMKLERGVYVGHAPAKYNRSDRILNSQSEGGQFIGRSTISEGGQTEIGLNHLTPGWVRSEWVPFQDHARMKPFFFSWMPDLYPNETIYGWSTSTPVPTVGGHNFYSVSIGMQGLIGPGVVEAP